jgi:site-specific recombinase XerD
MYASIIEKFRIFLVAKNYSKQSQKTYIHSIKEFLEHLSKPISNTAKEDFDQFLVFLREEKKLEASTINLKAAAISLFLKEIIQLKDHKSFRTRMKTPKSLPEVYSLEEIGHIISGVENSKHRAILMLAYGGGLRLSEIQKLRIQDVQFDRKIIKIYRGKGAKDRQIMLDVNLARLLQGLIPHNRQKGYIFTGAGGRAVLSRRTISKIYENACKKANIVPRGGIHLLRHSFATHLLENGTDMRFIQELLGHANINTTERYTHVANNTISKIKSPLSLLDQSKLVGKKVHTRSE